MTSLVRAVARVAVLVALAPGGLVHGQTAAEVAELRARAEQGDALIRRTV
jgi:protein-disulfide isomerase-like protein with CxxC motif